MVIYFSGVDTIHSISLKIFFDKLGLKYTI